MNQDKLKQAAEAIKAGDETRYIELVADYCIETQVKPEPANNAVAFGHCAEVPFYMDSKIEEEIKRRGANSG